MKFKQKSLGTWLHGGIEIPFVSITLLNQIFRKSTAERTKKSSCKTLLLWIIFIYKVSVSLLEPKKNLPTWAYTVYFHRQKIQCSCGIFGLKKCARPASQPFQWNKTGNLFFENSKSTEIFVNLAFFVNIYKIITFFIYNIF